MISEEELKAIYEKTKGIMHITQHIRFWYYFNSLKEKASLVDKQKKKIDRLKKDKDILYGVIDELKGVNNE